MASYLTKTQKNRKKTAQTESVPGKTQVQNNAGGFVFEVTPETQLDRFLILGTEGGSYYATEKDATAKACASAEALLKAGKGFYVIDRVVEISDGGRAPKNDQALFVLAMCASFWDSTVRRRALEKLHLVARTGTHLFQFLEFVQNMRGWGRSLRTAIGNWYLGKAPAKLAYQLVKYRQRNGWTHRDVLRLAKPRGKTSPSHEPLLQFAVGKGGSEATNKCPQIVKDYVQLSNSVSEFEVLSILHSNPDLPWETVPTEFLKSAHVWGALLPHLPYTALIRNLGRITSLELTKQMSDATKIAALITNKDAIKYSRVHPLTILNALYVYKAGHGVKGSLSWTPSQFICDALDEAFYISFGNVESTGKRTMLALDISGSMGWGKIAGMELTPRDAAAAMAMVTMHSEPNHLITAFTSGGRGYGGKWGGDASGLTPINVSKRMRLDTVVETVNALPMGGTDCALPMLYATENNIEVDTFIVYTDSETWAGNIHPFQALRDYRSKTGINAKLIVVGMVSNEFTIADPSDPGMLDVVGFDTATPNLIAEFSK